MFRCLRVAFIALTCASFVGLGMTTASAGDDGQYGQGSSSTTTESGGDGSTYYSKVTYTESGGGDSDGDGSTSVRSSDANFTPPVCWYESMTPAEFKSEIGRRYTAAAQENAGTVSEYYNGVNNKLNDEHYHEGDKGSWWVLAWDKNALTRTDHATCAFETGWLWQGPADPPPPFPVTPEVLAKAAYGAMTLPTRKVALNPAPGNQKVNLPTYVSFAKAIGQVSVTAQVGPVAATVVAVPYSLHVEAGTADASPQSCDYKFSGGTVNSADAGCNITYRRATQGSAYTLHAEITWKVTWNPSANATPGGQPMADGFSDSQTAVNVQEIQTINR
jgi:hypothetical protein